MQPRLKRVALALTVSMLPLLCLPWSASARGGFNRKACTFNGHKLYGSIQEVSEFPDVTVREVSGSADLRVKKVSGAASACGEWRMVSGFADTTVKFVAGSGDVAIQYVSGPTGMN